MCRVNRLPELHIFLPIVPKNEWGGYQYELRLALRAMLYEKWLEGWSSTRKMGRATPEYVRVYGGVADDEVVDKRLASLASIPVEPAG